MKNTESNLQIKCSVVKDKGHFIVPILHVFVVL